MSSHLLIPMHLGSLHPYETALLALIAFGPFVVLAIVVVVGRRRDSPGRDSPGRDSPGRDSPAEEPAERAKRPADHSG